MGLLAAKISSSSSSWMVISSYLVASVGQGQAYSAILGLRDKDVDDSSLDQTPDHEDDVGLPLDLLQGDGETELVDERTDGGEHVREGHSLSAHLEGEHLDGVKGLEWGPAERVDGLEDVDHGNRGGTGRLVTLLLLDTCGGGDTDPAEGACNVDPDEERTATKLIDKHGADEGHDALDGVHDDEEVGLGSGVGDTGSVQNTTQEV